MITIITYIIALIINMPNTSNKSTYDVKFKDYQTGETLTGVYEKNSGCYSDFNGEMKLKGDINISLVSYSDTTFKVLSDTTFYLK